MGDQAVSHDADDATAVQTLLHAQHCFEHSNLKNVVGHRRVDLAEESPHQRRILLVHQYFDVDLLARQSHRSHDLETAEMRTQQQASAPAGHRPTEYVRPADGNGKLIEASPEKVQAIENGRRKAVDRK